MKCQEEVIVYFDEREEIELFCRCKLRKGHRGRHKAEGTVTVRGKKIECIVAWKI